MLFRSRRFFAEPSQRDGSGVGIAEEPVDASVGNESRERVEVTESGEVGHAPIVTDCASAEKRKPPWKQRSSGASKGESYPHYSAKSRHKDHKEINKRRIHEFKTHGPSKGTCE